MNAARLRLFWVLILIGLLPFVILAFFNSMAADDYLYYDIYRTRPFFEVQRLLYTGWGGRFTSSFLIGCFIRLDWPGRFPWLPTLLYFAATWGAVCYLLSTVYTILRQGHLSISRVRILQSGALLFFIFLYVQADIGTGFYWFSATVVYQTAFILFLLLAATLMRRLNSPGLAPTWDLLIFLLIFLIMGCNEIIAVFLPLLILSLILACRFFGRPAPRWLWVCQGTTLAIGVLIVFTSGVLTQRQKGMNLHHSYWTILPVIGFQTLAMMYYIFKEPLFWMSAASLYVLGGRISQNWPSPGALIPFRKKNIFLPGLLTLLVVMVLSLSAFLIASRGSIPPRALNNLGDISCCCLLIICFLAGVNQGARRPFATTARPSRSIQLAILVAVTLASVNYLSAWKSVVSGYFYHAVLSERDRQLRIAQAENRHTATVIPYDSALKEQIHRVFPHGIFETVHTILLQKPSMLYYYDGAGRGDPAYAHFYGLDSIILRQN